jgi:ribosome-associated toxin RatA of RatAB toxin-antitoxin module
MGRPLAVALALALVSVSRTSVAQTPQFSDAERARLESGEILVKRVEPKGGAGVAAKAVALVRSHPDRVWPIVNDCTNFKEFMPRTTKSEERADGKHCLVEVTMPFPFSNLWSETKVRQEVLDNGGRRRAWSLVDGTYEHLTGSWTVLPWGENGKETLLLYTIDANPDVSVPDMILRSAQEGTLPDIFTAVRARAGAPWPKG